MLLAQGILRIITPEEKETIEEEIKELPKEEQKKVKEELEITKPTEAEKPSVLETVGSKIDNALASLWWGLVDTGKSVTRVTIQLAQETIQTAKTTSSQIAFEAGQALTIASEAASKQLEIVSSAAKDGLLAMTNNIGQTISNTAKSIGQGYNQLANNAPGVTKTILVGIGKGISTSSSAITLVTKAVASSTAAIAQNTVSAVGNITSGNVVTNVAKNVGKGISQIQVASQAVSGIKNTAGNIFGPPLAALSGQTNRLVEKTTTYLAITAEYWFDKEPTKILAVNVEKVSPTSAVIYWQTNHHATSTVNYGLDTSYGKKVQSSERVKEHRLELTDLEAGKTYFFEVMSQNKNYVYDAYYTFSTPKIEEEKVKGAITEKSLKKPMVEIVGNKNDWIFVRREPNREGDVVAKVQVGQTFPFLQEKDGCLLIKFDGEEGWMFGEYGKLIESQE